MKRIIVELPDDLGGRLEQEAGRRGVTISDLTCEALESLLGTVGRRRLLAAGAGLSGRSDVSERIDEILREESLGTLRARRE